MKCSSDGHNHREFRTIRGIQIKKEIVGMIEIVITIGTRIVINAAEAGQKEKGSAVVGGSVVNWFTFFFRINRHGGEPLRQTFAHVLLKKSLALDSVRIAAQDQSPIAQKGQDEIRHAIVVGEQISFRYARLGKRN